MTATVRDEDLGVTYQTTVTPYQVDNGEGAELSDLYLVEVTGTFLDDGGEQVERAELIVHRPEEDR